jgi:HK97 family phage portal protein
MTVVEAAGIAAVRRCVTLIANGIAGSPWTQWADDERVPNHPLVDRPARLMTRREWAWRAIATMALYDVCYVYMTGGVDDEGVPGSLIPLPPQSIRPSGYVDPYGVFPPTSYQIGGIADPVSAEFVIPLRSVFWPGIPPHLVGILNLSRQVLMSSFAADAYGAKYWQGGGSPTTVITTEQDLTNTQADAIGERWRQRRVKGPDFPAVMGKGAKAEPWGADVSGQAAVEAKREIAIEVANLFGVPARYINVPIGGSSQTYANLNDESLSLERYTLSGFVDPIEDCISDLLPDPNMMRVDMSRLTRAGQEARFRSWMMALGQKPWIMPGEVRRLEGMSANADIDRMAEATVEKSEAGADVLEAQADAQEAQSEGVANAV